MAKIKILYVDSQKDYSSKLLANIIEKNYTVKFSNNIKDALISYSQDKPDLLLCDSNIDDIDAFPFLKKLKIQDSDLKLVVITNNTDNKILLNAIDINVDKFLFKDNDFSELNNYIKSLEIKRNEQTVKNNLNLTNLGNDFFYVEEENKIIFNNKNIDLTTQEDYLISELIRLKGNFIPTCSLQDIIGKGDRASIDTLRTVIRRIRKNLFKYYSK